MKSGVEIDPKNARRLFQNALHSTGQPSGYREGPAHIQFLYSFYDSPSGSGWNPELHPL